MSEAPIATPPLLVELSEARCLLSCGRTKLDDLRNAGEVKGVRNGKIWVTMESIVTFTERLKKQKERNLKVGDDPALHFSRREDQPIAASCRDVARSCPRVGNFAGYEEHRSPFARERGGATTYSDVGDKVWMSSAASQGSSGAGNWRSRSVTLDNPLTSGQLTAAEVGDDVAVVSADHFLAVSLGQKVIDTPSIRLCVA